MRVAIVALGPSGLSYARIAEGLGYWRTHYDQLYLVNGFVNVFWPPDGSAIGFAMDDVRIQEARAKAGNKKIEYLLESYKKHPGPIFTSREHPDYPALKAYPIEDVLNACGRDYFNNTVAYAIAYAIHERVAGIDMYGADYTYKNRHVAEAGRACCEYWLGVASARGIKIGVSKNSQLLDANEPRALYGYDTQDVIREKDENGYVHVEFKDKEQVPTGEEIEQRYYKGDGSTADKEAA